MSGAPACVQSVSVDTAFGEHNAVEKIGYSSDRQKLFFSFKMARPRFSVSIPYLVFSNTNYKDTKQRLIGLIDYITAMSYTDDA